MRIFVTTHGSYEANHISLVTVDFDLAVKHFLDYSKTGWINSMGSIEIWEDNKQLLSYGSMSYDIVNNRFGKDSLTYDDIKNDILKQLKEV